MYFADCSSNEVLYNDWVYLALILITPVLTEKSIPVQLVLCIIATDKLRDTSTFLDSSSLFCYCCTRLHYQFSARLAITNKKARLTPFYHYYMAIWNFTGSNVKRLKLNLLATLRSILTCTTTKSTKK